MYARYSLGMTSTPRGRTTQTSSRRSRPMARGGITSTQHGSSRPPRPRPRFATNSESCRTPTTSSSSSMSPATPAHGRASMSPVRLGLRRRTSNDSHEPRPRQGRSRGTRSRRPRETIEFPYAAGLSGRPSAHDSRSLSCGHLDMSSSNSNRRNEGSRSWKTSR